jgi:peptide deformylase
MFSASLAKIPSPEITIIGNPILRATSSFVTNQLMKTDQFFQSKLSLHRALYDFRAKHGFGRGISAPQIGINQRFIALNLGYGRFLFCSVCLSPFFPLLSFTLLLLFSSCVSLQGILR